MSFPLLRWTFAVALLLFVNQAAGAGEAKTSAVAPWATYRGNAQRTGNTDNLPGPAKPSVLWMMPSKDHFIASPVPAKDRLYISGLGAFNVANFYCVSSAPKADKRVLWSKTTPYLKIPTVSSPALLGDRLVFGDGMHQTDGATLHCLQDTGLPLWQLPVPGKLVHLEGSPTVAGGRIYIGGGAAGVLCVDPNRVTLEGKEMELPEIQKILAQRWKQLLAKYEADKKKDPEFAIPPTEDQLPRASPRRVWQQGQEKWHVDAPVAVAGDKVLVASAFLDKEQVGDRAVYCLDAGTGAIRWRTPLKINPWGGPSVLGDLVVVSGSTIGYDTKALKGAKGQVAVLDLKDGKEKWRKDVQGGVVSCVALADLGKGEAVAVCTATDGKVRAFDLKTGERRWIYDAKSPLFAPPAIAGGVVYVGDLKGVLHAVELSSGQGRWVYDVGPTAPGMFYGGPVVHGGRVYAATCNLEGPNAGRPTTVFCLGDN